MRGIILHDHLVPSVFNATIVAVVLQSLEKGSLTGQPVLSLATTAFFISRMRTVPKTLL
jgi:hypothetical protein